MWTDVFFSPMVVDNLVEVLVSMYRRDLSGVYHVAGSESCSKYAFGQAVASAFGLDAGLIEPTSVGEARLIAPRPRNLSLDVTRAATVQDIRLLNVGEGIARFRGSAAVHPEPHIP